MAPAWQGDCSASASGRLRPCIRRRRCGSVAARLDESPRGSGPNQWRALGALRSEQGVPIHFRQFAITSRCTLPSRQAAGLLASPCSLFRPALPDSFRPI